MSDDQKDPKDTKAENIELGKQIGEAQIAEEKKAADEKK